MDEKKIDLPDQDGKYGVYGGRYVAETLVPALEELDKEYKKIKNNKEFQSEVFNDLRTFVGRPSPLYFAERLTKHYGAGSIWLKREDLNHTGAHKINNTVGQILLAKHMGKKRIIAETGAGQHGVATATVCARHGLDCVVYMGAHDVERQAPNVFRMKLLGAEVIPVTSGRGTLKDAMNDALRDWVTYVDETFYCIGTVAGPHPYPAMVRDFQSIIGKETKEQIMEAEGRLPDSLIACIGGGSNAIGLFHPFLDERDVRIIGVEAGGKGMKTGKHAAPLNDGKEGILHGMRTYLMQDDSGQIAETHSISAGLDYPGVGPLHAFLYESGRAKFMSATDQEALDAAFELTKIEGIMPALETAHGLAYAKKLAPTMKEDQVIVVNVSGRGDKDINTVAGIEGIEL